MSKDTEILLPGFFIDRETVAEENRGKCKVYEKDLKVSDSYNVSARADPKIFGFGKSRKSRTNPKISIRDFVRKDIFRSLFVWIWSIRSFGNFRIPNPERSDYTNLMRNYEACKGAKIGSIRPEPINWSPGGYRMADKINQTVSQSIHGWMKTLSRSFSVMSTRRLCFVAANENWLKSLNIFVRVRSGFRDFKLFRSGSFGK